MNELLHLKSLVKRSNKSVKEVVDEYFKTVTWSILKDEYSHMSKREKSQLFNKLAQVRK